MTDLTAFNPQAFQNNAFQIETNTPPLVPTQAPRAVFLPPVTRTILEPPKKP